MQRVFICEQSSTCPLFDYTWDWLVESRASEISSLVYLFFQFARSIDSCDRVDPDMKSKGKGPSGDASSTGSRETLRVVFEPPIPRKNSRRQMKERIMRYANNINALASRTSRLKAGRAEQRQQSIAMVTAANEQIRVALFCEANFDIEDSRKITEQILEKFVGNYAPVLKELEPEFAEEAKDQNEARTHLKYMQRFRDFVGDLSKLLEKQPKSTAFTQQTVTSESIRSRVGSKFDDAEEKGGMIPAQQGHQSMKDDGRISLTDDIGSWKDFHRKMRNKPSVHPLIGSVKASETNTFNAIRSASDGVSSLAGSLRIPSDVSTPNKIRIQFQKNSPKQRTPPSPEKLSPRAGNIRPKKFTISDPRSLSTALQRISVTNRTSASSATDGEGSPLIDSN
mmetsp:Transcript_10898/g.26716  ORF Transcript_10898/g.26716 Transcript_10898/m.26716 type:complete len:396 (-) Transcript_10898:227-1414(-)